MAASCRTLCNSEAVNEFPVCLWNESEYCLVHLVQVNIYQKPDTRKSLFATPPFYLPHLLLMFGQKQIGFKPMQGEYPERQTEGQYILSCPQCFWFLSQQYKVCHCVLSCRIPWPQTWHAWPSLSSSYFASPCSTSAPVVHLAPERLCHLVSLVSIEIAHSSEMMCCYWCYWCLSDLFFLILHRDAAAEEDGVKSQLDRLWQEVNSLKEMQALQTGTTLTK